MRDCSSKPLPIFKKDIYALSGNQVSDNFICPIPKIQSLLV